MLQEYLYVLMMFKTWEAYSKRLLRRVHEHDFSESGSMAESVHGEAGGISLASSDVWAEEGASEEGAPAPFTEGHCVTPASEKVEHDDLPHYRRARNRKQRVQFANAPMAASLA